MIALSLGLFAVIAFALLDETVSPWQSRDLFKWLALALCLALIVTTMKSWGYRQELRALIRTCR